jgi:alpha-ketoglutarate-dependent taurine dioxygenase
MRTIDEIIRDYESERDAAVRERDDARRIALERYQECEELRAEMGEPNQQVRSVTALVTAERDALRAEVAQLKSDLSFRDEQRLVAKEQRDEARAAGHNWMSIAKAAQGRAEKAEAERDVMRQAWKRVGAVLSDEGCSCEQDHDTLFLDEQCLGHRIEHAWKPATSGES